MINPHYKLLKTSSKLFETIEYNLFLPRDVKNAIYNKRMNSYSLSSSLRDNIQNAYENR